MCKKLMFLISLVLVLGSIASATDYQWTDEYPWSYLYISPWNWNPVAPYGGPGAGGTCQDTAIIQIVPDPIVMDTKIQVNNFTVRTDQFDHDLYFIKDCNMYICSTLLIRDDPYQATLYMEDSAKVSTNTFSNHGDNGDAIVNISDNARLTCRREYRFGDDGGVYHELNMTDNAYLYVANSGDRMRQNEGEFHIDLSGNAFAEVAYLRARGRSDDLTDTITIRENAVFKCYQDYFRTTGGASNLIMTVTDNAVVDVKGYIGFGEDNDWEGDAVLNMDGQLIKSGGDFRFVMDGDSVGFTTVNLMCGLIDTGGNFSYNTENWVVNICGCGVWVVNGDRVADVRAQELNGHWVSCPQEDCFGRISPRGNLMVDYNTPEYPGKTKIWVQVIEGEVWAPMPVSGATGIPPIAELCWCPGEIECPNPQYHIFLSDNKAEVEAGSLHAWKGVQTGNCYTTEPLCLGKTYYWRIDTVGECCMYPGPVWQFTVVDRECVEDMEAYNDVSNPIWQTWLDGCGDANGVGGNGTGSCVYTDTAVVHGGDKSMLYYYDCSGEDMSGDERDCNYAIATRAYADLDLSSSCAEAIELWFYGDPGNDATALEAMFMSVKDGSDNSAVATYGATAPESLADMQVAEWQQWDIALSSFGGVDTTNIVSMSLGFGDVTNCDREKGGYGVMRLDDICIFACRCVPKYTPDIVDLNDDCVTDWKDIKLVADTWLDDRRCNQ